jgi:hypothetical protein
MMSVKTLLRDPDVAKARRMQLTGRRSALGPAFFAAIEVAFVPKKCASAIAMVFGSNTVPYDAYQARVSGCTKAFQSALSIVSSLGKGVFRQNTFALYALRLHFRTMPRLSIFGQAMLFLLSPSVSSHNSLEWTEHEYR